MDRDWLEAELAAGRSIEAIARELGRPPSTVAYWAQKHGLRSRFAAKHAGRGGLDRETLATLIERGLSIRAIAAELGVSYATVQHWLRKYGLQSARTSGRVASDVSTDFPDARRAQGRCPRHGTTDFIARAGGGWRCLKCRAEAVSKRRRAVKATLVAEAGGRCHLCGYARSVAALEFHHVDPATKAFHLSQGGVSRSLAAARAEAAKCVLLCANCHAEVEAGVATLGDAPADNPG